MSVNLGNTNINEIFALLKTERDNLERVNNDLIHRLEKKEREIGDLNNEILDMKDQIYEKDKALEKAQSIIRKLNEDYVKSISDLERTEASLEKIKEEKRDLVKESKEHQKMFQDMEILKKTEERYRNQTKKLQKDLNDLAVVSGEDKQQQENNLKILLDQKEQFEKLIEEMEEKMKELQVHCCEQETLLEQEGAKNTELEKNILIKDDEMKYTRKDCDNKCIEMQDELEHTKRMAANTIRSLHTTSSISNKSTIASKSSFLERTGFQNPNLSKRLAEVLRSGVRSHSYKIDKPRPEERDQFLFSRMGLPLKQKRRKANENIGDTRENIDFTPASQQKKLSASTSQYHHQHQQVSHKPGRFSMIKPQSKTLAKTSPFKTSQKLNLTVTPSRDSIVKMSPAKKRFNINTFQSPTQSLIDPRRDSDSEDDEYSQSQIIQYLNKLELFSPVVFNDFLKAQLNNAFEKEQELGKKMMALMMEDAQFISKTLDNLKEKENELYPRLERWKMRNEELETRLIDLIRKTKYLEKFIDGSFITIKQLVAQQQEERKQSETIKQQQFEFIEFLLSEINTERADLLINILPKTQERFKGIVQRASQNLDRLGNKKELLEKEIKLQVDDNSGLKTSVRTITEKLKSLNQSSMQAQAELSQIEHAVSKEFTKENADVLENRKTLTRKQADDVINIADIVSPRIPNTGREDLETEEFVSERVADIVQKINQYRILGIRLKELEIHFQSEKISFLSKIEQLQNDFEKERQESQERISLKEQLNENLERDLTNLKKLFMEEKENHELTKTTLENQVKSLLNSISEHEDINKRTREEVEQMKADQLREIAFLEEQIQKREELNEATQYEMGTRKDQLSHQSDQMKALKRQLDEKEEEILRKRRIISDKEDDLIRMQDLFKLEKERMESEIEYKKTRLQDLTEDLEKSHSVNEKFRTERNILEAEFSSTNKNLRLKLESTEKELELEKEKQIELQLESPLQTEVKEEEIQAYGIEDVSEQETMHNIHTRVETLNPPYLSQRLRSSPQNNELLSPQPLLQNTYPAPEHSYSNSLPQKNPNFENMLDSLISPEQHYRLKNELIQMHMEIDSVRKQLLLKQTEIEKQESFREGGRKRIDELQCLVFEKQNTISQMQFLVDQYLEENKTLKLREEILETELRQMQYSLANLPPSLQNSKIISHKSDSTITFGETGPQERFSRHQESHLKESAISIDVLDPVNVKEKARKLSIEKRLEFYERVIERLHSKKMKAKKSYEKRVFEFETLLRFLEVHLNSHFDSDDDYYSKSRISQIQSQVQQIISKNPNLKEWVNGIKQKMDAIFDRLVHVVNREIQTLKALITGSMQSSNTLTEITLLKKQLTQINECMKNTVTNQTEEIDELVQSITHSLCKLLSKPSQLLLSHSPSRPHHLSTLSQVSNYSQGPPTVPLPSRASHLSQSQLSLEEVFPDDKSLNKNNHT